VAGSHGNDVYSNVMHRVSILWQRRFLYVRSDRCRHGGAIIFRGGVALEMTLMHATVDFASALFGFHSHGASIRGLRPPAAAYITAAPPLKGRRCELMVLPNINVRFATPATLGPQLKKRKFEFGIQQCLLKGPRGDNPKKTSTQKILAQRAVRFNSWRQEAT